MDVLIEVCDEPETSHKVIEELQKGENEGYDFLRNAIEKMPNPSRSSTARNKPIASIPVTSMTERPFRDNPDIDQLDDGEASLICYTLDEFFEKSADARQYPEAEKPDRVTPIATDDLDARNVAKQFGVPCTGSIGILAKAVKDGAVTVEAADQDLHSWIDGNGYHSPVGSVTEIL